MKSSSAGILIMSSPDDQAALDQCKSEHSDIAAIREQLTELTTENNGLKVRCRELEHTRETGDEETQAIMKELGSAREEIRQLNEKQVNVDARNSKKEKEAKARDTQQRDVITTPEAQLECFESQESTNHRSNGQLSEC